MHYDFRDSLGPAFRRSPLDPRYRLVTAALAILALPKKYHGYNHVLGYGSTITIPKNHGSIMIFLVGGGGG